MKEARNKPDEVSSFEYLSEHLYQRANNGGFEVEFQACKRVISGLGSFTTLHDFIQSVEQTSSIKEQVILEIKLAWQANYEIRSAIGIILLLALWQDIPESKPEAFYYNLFVRLEKRGIYARSN